MTAPAIQIAQPTTVAQPAATTSFIAQPAATTSFIASPPYGTGVATAQPVMSGVPAPSAVISAPRTGGVQQQLLANAAFNAMDTNRDGRLDRQELANAMTGVVQAQPVVQQYQTIAAPQTQIVVPPTAPIAGQAAYMQQGADLFSRVDANRDGVISRQEFANFQNQTTMMYETQVAPPFLSTVTPPAPQVIQVEQPQPQMIVQPQPQTTIVQPQPQTFVQPPVQIPMGPLPPVRTSGGEGWGYEDRLRWEERIRWEERQKWQKEEVQVSGERVVSERPISREELAQSGNLVETAPTMLEKGEQSFERDRYDRWESDRLQRDRWEYDRIQTRYEPARYAEMVTTQTQQPVMYPAQQTTAYVQQPSTYVQQTTAYPTTYPATTYPSTTYPATAVAPATYVEPMSYPTTTFPVTTTAAPQTFVQQSYPTYPTMQAYPTQTTSSFAQPYPTTYVEAPRGYSGSSAGMFDMLDSNRDGRIDRSEFSRAFQGGVLSQAPVAVI